MDELTLRLECLRLACTARTGNDVLGQADTYLKYVTRDGALEIPNGIEALSPDGGLTPRQQQEVREILMPKNGPNTLPDPQHKSANERMNEKLTEGNARVRDKLGLTDAARRT